MPKGLNRTDLISLDQARARPNVIYGGFVNKKKEILVTDYSPLDYLARWATEQGGLKYAGAGPSAASPVFDSEFPPFMAFMDSAENFEDDSFCQDHGSFSGSLTSGSPASQAAPVFPPPVTTRLIPLHVARNRPDIRYRPEGFEMF